MMIPHYQFWQFLALLGVHWVADFVCQTHWQASNKSKSNVALAKHVAVYTGILAVASGVLFRYSPIPNAIGNVLIFISINGALHFSTDYFTSRWSSKLYAKQDWHNFFVVIGFDQLIHQATLAMTMWWLLVDRL